MGKRLGFGLSGSDPSQSGHYSKVTVKDVFLHGWDGGVNAPPELAWN